MNDLNMKGRLVQMVQLNTCTSQLETPRVHEHARTQDLATARSGGDRSWSRAQTAGVRWHMRGGSAAHARLCARPMAQSRMSLCALLAGVCEHCPGAVRTRGGGFPGAASLTLSTIRLTTLAKTQGGASRRPSVLAGPMLCVYFDYFDVEN